MLGAVHCGVYTPLNALACSVCNAEDGRAEAIATALHRAVRMTFTYYHVKEQGPDTSWATVELVGFEPTASCLQSRCSTN